MRNRLAGMIVLTLVLAACATPQAVPPTETPSPETPTDVPTEAPTQRPIQRATLPPEWTEAPVLTNTPAPTSTSPPTNTPNPAVPTVAQPTRSPSCDIFGPDLNRLERQFTPGEDVTVYWIPVDDAAFYHIALLDDEGNEVATDFTDESGYVFSADEFEPGRIYGWEAYPINALGQQFCRPQGAELVPVNFAAN